MWLPWWSLISGSMMPNLNCFGTNEWWIIWLNKLASLWIMENGATIIMKNFVALPEQLHRKNWPKKTKIAQKNHVFEFINLETTFKGQGTLIFFPLFLKITCLEVPKKVSGHISQKWRRYNHLKWCGKTEKHWKWRSFRIF